MHHLLKRQLCQLGLSDKAKPTSENWSRLLETVSQSYTGCGQFDSGANSISFALKDSLLSEQKAYSFRSKYLAILNALPDLLFLLDEDGLYVEILANNADKQDLYKPANILLGKRISDVFPTQQAKKFLSVISKAINEDSLQLFEYQLDVLSGATHFEGRVSATDYEVNGRKTVLFLARDITSQIASRQQERLLSSVMQSATEGVVVINGNRQVLYANHAISHLTGFSKEELLSAGEGFIRHDLDKILCEEIYSDALLSDHTQREIALHKKTGEETQVLLNLDILRNERGEIEYMVGLITDMSDVFKSRKMLEHLASHDRLTGLPNRSMFEQRIKESISRVARSNQQGALIFLDLDRFKKINDSLGHSVGDDLLKQVAKRLLHVSRKEDVIARFGGDEFVIILDGISTPIEASRIAQKILNVFKDKFLLQGFDIEISASIGITFFPHYGTDIEKLVKQADSAMYAAKESGRNCFHLFTEELSVSAMKGLTLEIEMRKALDNDEFFLEYQPQYSLKSGVVTRFESLIRWQQPDKGLIYPIHFITAAETAGLIDEIGLWVFREVCLQVCSWKRKNLKFDCISFNLSRLQLKDKSLASHFLEILKETGALKYTQYLECEITESAIIKQNDIAFKNLNFITEMGIKLAIDDFGTGHSSLVNLKRFPLSCLKIDQVFVNDVGCDQNDEVIINATIALAQSFGLTVVAEGVESEKQAQFLKQAGCDLVQGFYYYASLSAKDAQLLLSEE